METVEVKNQESSTGQEDVYRLHRRFDRMGRLIGDDAMKRLMNSHVMVIGLGGVGSWAAESLARSGVGTLSVVDFDEICITNSNRQLHAMAGLVGRLKSEVMAERLRKINPQAKVNAISEFYNADSSDLIFSYKPDFIVDAIDNITTKCHLLARCVKDGIPVVCSTGSAGKLDPTRIRIADLSETERDPLARSIRRILRQQYGFPENGSFGIPSVYSDEEVIEPVDLKYDNGQGFKCVCPQGQNGLNTCDRKNVILGNASFVTGSFGLACASVAVKKLSTPLPS
ncbi:MAG: tRNA threonylcarbamoyladenosine dehydratase [Bdellovibrionales bacterium]|nr:tRNA threonylcarbamoyladenosine dehydratase [Bdellovibrionales bacterium]